MSQGRVAETVGTNMHRFTITCPLAGRVKRFAQDESGATAIEYAMIASSIAVAIAAAVMSLGTATTGMYESVATGFK